MTDIHLVIQIPGICRNYTFVANSAMTVEQARDQVIQRIREEENNQLFSGESEILVFSVNLERLLEGGSVLAETGVVDGDMLLLLI